jgi:hypothetical protein
LSGAELAIGVAAGLAVLHAIVASRRDLGVMPLAALGIALCLGVELSPQTGAAIAAVLGITAVGWSRAASHGVGRPGLTGWVLAAAVLGALVAILAPELAPGVPAERFAAVAAGGVALVGTLAAGVALERPGPRRRAGPIRRAVPVEGPE